MSTSPVKNSLEAGDANRSLIENTAQDQGESGDRFNNSGKTVSGPVNTDGIRGDDHLKNPDLTVDPSAAAPVNTGEELVAAPNRGGRPRALRQTSAARRQEQYRKRQAAKAKAKAAKAAASTTASFAGI